jgi:aminoglycoside 6'-N-acetyltransferase
MTDSAHDTAAGLALAPFTPRDDVHLARWLASPAVAAWWGNRGAAEARVRMAAESSSALRCMVRVDGLPIGYGHALDSADVRDLAEAGLPAGTWVCDLFVGSEPHRGQGLGSAALDLLVGEVFATTLAVACATIVPVASERVARGCERIGFRWTRVIRDPAIGMVWVMLRDRPRH